MWRLLQFNIRISIGTSLYFLLIIVVYETILIVNKLASLYTVIPYLTMITFIFLYRSAFYGNHNFFDNAMILQSSLPVRKLDIIRSNYIFNYLQTITIVVLNYIPGIVFRNEVFQNMETLGNFIMIILLTILSYNVAAPSVIHTTSFKNIIITTSMVIIFLILCNISMLIIKHSPLPVIYLNGILVLLIIITYSPSVKKSMERLDLKFE
ncbi:ABC-2 transporter permease [Vallitalea pronyensis]|uniref:ABC-2 transporter permease n=1 Tax=Vallitalea pronyensis TaxID=1348613 RepID=A0A8J8MLL4_9FIRM|nr:ABC-2 transporter permease [Vallitalea pronyensis]QUI23734.1 ABC-2 transporter permease [Vallitalea pronyensis]